MIKEGEKEVNSKYRREIIPHRMLTIFRTVGKLWNDSRLVTQHAGYTRI